jgi:NitT/TauT family transport system permease protein
MSQRTVGSPGLDDRPEAVLAPFDPDEVGPSGEATGGVGVAEVAAGVVPRLISIGLIFVLWALASAAVGTSVIPSPSQVWAAFLDAVHEGYIWSDMLITFARLLAAFALAMVLAIVIGLAIGTIGWVAKMFDFWVTIGAAVPSLLIIVVCYLWLGLNERAAIVAAALVVAPSATFNVIQGVRSIDPGLSEMARAFGVPKLAITRRVLFPQTLPYLFAAARSCLSLTWKIIIFVELMGRSSGVGYRIQYFYSLFNMERVLASALPFMLVMLLVELVVLRRLERHLFRWRREEAR